MKKMKKISVIFTILLLTTATFTLLSAQTQVGDILYGEANQDGFGSHVSYSADGTRLATSTPFNNALGFNTGHARVFELSNGNWIQIGEDIDGVAPGDRFGASLALSANGNRMAVGAPSNDDNGNNAGHVRVFEISNGNLTQIGADIQGGLEITGFGQSLSISADGNRVAIGAEGNFGLAGFAQIYELNNGNWTQMGATLAGKNAHDGFGRTISLSADGNVVAVSAPFNNNASGDRAGQVSIYEFDGSAWSQIGQDIEGETQDYYLGIATISLTPNGNKLVVDGNQASINEILSGQVRVFELIGDTWTQIGQSLNGEAAYDRFGAAIALSNDGTNIAITAIGEYPINTSYIQFFELIDGAWIQMGDTWNGEDVYHSLGSALSYSADGSRLAVGASGGKNLDGVRTGYVVVYQLQTVSTKDILEDAVQIYPNPTTRKIDIQGVDYESLKIFDQLGRIVINNKKPDTTVDLSDLRSGIYFIQLHVKDQVITKKIVKK